MFAPQSGLSLLYLDRAGYTLAHKALQGCLDMMCVCVCVCSEKKESVYVCGVQIFQSHRLNNKYWRDRVHTYTRSGLWMT